MKKWMILAAVILVVLGIGFAVKGASDRKLTVQPSETALPEATAEPEQAALTDETQTEDGMTQVYMLHGQITEITDEYLMLEGTEQGTVQVNLLDDTLYDGAIQQSELAVGQYAEVLYDGKLTRSIPAQAAALAVNIYPLAGTVDEVQEDGRVLVTPTDGGAQVLLSLPDDVTVEAGETATFYTTGVATMSLPAQMNAILLKSGSPFAIDGKRFTRSRPPRPAG